jgi:YbgC/YbaW family acyl-CoA thioester hydrolase
MTQNPVILTVYPDDCDAFGHLNQAAFLTLFERARWEALAAGPGMDLFERAAVWPAVRRATIDYHAPALPGQSLRFQQVVTRLGRTSFAMRQVARRDGDEALIATLESVFVCIDRSGAAVPVPPSVAAFLAPAPEAVASGPPRRLTVHGVELALDDRGAGPAILFIHGYPFDRTLWQHQLGAFEGWRTLAPDLRGLGRSDAPDLGYSMATYAEDLAALLDAVGVDDVVLCGLSMGGYVAFEFLRRHRPRVRGLVLVDTRAGADSVEGRKGREVAMTDLREGGPPLIAEQMLPRLLAVRAPEALRQEVRSMMAAAQPAGVLGALAAMRDRPDSTELLPTLAGLPTLVVVGAEDRLTPPRDAEAMAKAVPGARLALIPEAGHLSPLEQPAAFNGHLRSFLARLSGSTPAMG